jgi:hypothetical protein
MSGEGFLARWSRLKRGEAEAEPEPTPEAEPPPEGPPPEAPPPAGAVAIAPPVPEAVEEKKADDESPDFDLASLPSIESLTAGSDITVFLRAGVPRALRDAALRRLWTLDPAIREFIGPADYAWDYNAPDGVPGFSPVLGGDLKKLLAQAIGDEAVEEQKQKRQAEAGAAAQESPAPPAEQDVPEPAPPAIAQDDGEQHEQRQQQQQQAMMEPAAALPEESLPSPPRRRHGGAVPT